MLFRARVNCPDCQGSRCRESRWFSSDEKRAHPGCVPYRCLGCSHRFLAHKGARTDNVFAVSVPLALLALVVAATLAFWLGGVDNTSVLLKPATPAALDPEVIKAAAAGDALAQFRVGESLLHEPGRGGENSAKAIRWLQLSAENGNTDAMVTLGRLSRTGVGILQNFEQSAKWIQTAATRGDPQGMLELGRLYRDGVGFEKNPVQAYVWFNRAAAARDLDAVREREAIARTLTFDELKAAQNQSSAPDAGGGNAASAATPK